MFKAIQAVMGIPSTVVYETFGIYHQKISRWIKTGLISPSIQIGKGGRLPNGEYSKTLFSWEDFLEIKTIVSLRHQGMSLQKIRKVLEYIRSKGYKLHEVEYLTNGKVLFIKDLEGQIVEIDNTDQFVLLDWNDIYRFCSEHFKRHAIPVNDSKIRIPTGVIELR